MTYYIYVLQCAGGTLYTGITPELQKRMRQHCGELAGGAKYTRSHPPPSLPSVCVSPCPTATPPPPGLNTPLRGFPGRKSSLSWKRRRSGRRFCRSCAKTAAIFRQPTAHWKAI